MENDNNGKGMIKMAYYNQPSAVQGYQNYNNWQGQNVQAVNQQPMTNQMQQMSYPQIGQPQYPVQQMLPGRIIQQESDIVAREVPNDGNFAVFVQQDLQKIYAKTWGGDGRIHTNVYELVNGQEKEPDLMAVILQRLDNIEKTLKETQQYRPYSNRSKKPYRKPRNNEESTTQEG